MESAFDAPGTFVANNNVVSQSVAHLHVHVVPRWSGDTNFMTALDATRVVPQSLADTWAQLAPAFARAMAAAGLA